MAKQRMRNCGWCGQQVVSNSKDLKELVEHLEKRHNDFSHKRT